MDINALIAGAIPVIPPDDWFENPGLDRPTAIRVAPDGRVFGHVASWNTNHIGMPHGVRPPRSRSGYAYFRTGEIQTASGKLLPVGQLTLSGGHAGLEKTASQAAKHYDDTQSAIADVTVGEDAHGIWVAGAVRPDASPEQIRALRASAPSGDWRMINGSLEMVAVCQVNVPGFPIPRALAASGQRVSLVAAGSLPLLAQVLAQQEFEQRLQRLEAMHAERESRNLVASASAAKARIEAARQASLREAAELTKLRIRDPERYQQIVAAGTFKYLPPGFLADKANKQTRDHHGRFLQDGATVRWYDNGGGNTFHYGQVVNNQVNQAGAIFVKEYDTGKVVPLTPKDIEKIKAVLPSDHVDSPNDRGVPFKKGEDSGHAVNVTHQNRVASIEDAYADDEPDQGELGVGDLVGSPDGSGPLGVITDCSDPTAVEVTDPDGLVTVYEISELVPLDGPVDTPQDGLLDTDDENDIIL